MDIIKLRPINGYFTHRETKKVITHSEYKEIQSAEVKRRWNKMPENIRKTLYENDSGMFAAYLSDFEGAGASEWDNFEDYYPSDEKGNLVENDDFEEEIR